MMGVTTKGKDALISDERFESERLDSKDYRFVVQKGLNFIQLIVFAERDARVFIIHAHSF